MHQIIYFKNKNILKIILTKGFSSKKILYIYIWKWHRRQSIRGKELA